MGKALLAAGLIIFAATARAGPTPPASCANLSDGRERLACYDDHFGVTVTKSPPTPSKWRKQVKTNPLTDDTDVFLTLLSEEPVPGRFGSAGFGTLHLRCMENTTAVQFAVGDHFLASIQGYGRVEYRLDDQPMRSHRFRESTSHETLGLWSGREAIPFIKAMLGHDRMIVRITPFNESPKTMTFNISGLDADITELRDTCHW